MVVESATAWVGSTAPPQVVHQAHPVRRCEGGRDPQGRGDLGVALPQGEQAQDVPVPLRSGSEHLRRLRSATAHGG